ncbi:MAG: hypothetical protein IKA72_02525 [Clostridia bacterium]|nr:hypothetical protein [Clostridia bacterium]
MEEIRAAHSTPKTFKALARQAKERVKTGFWQDCKEDIDERMEKVKELGLNESKAGRYFKQKVSASLLGEKEDEFYLKVKDMLLKDGEVSDAIGRLTDKAHYESLTYEEKQRYTLSLSERYLRALERFRREYEFDKIDL